MSDAPSLETPTSKPLDTISATGTASADRLFMALCGLALLATTIGVGRHICEAIAEQLPDDGSWWLRLQTVPWSAWWFAVLHFISALASLFIGYVVIAWAYPRRGLAREGRTNPAAAILSGAHLMSAVVITGVSWGGLDASSLLVSATFCALGWLAMIIITFGHRVVTRYHDEEEIAAGNTAAALSAAGLQIAVVVVVSHAIQGQFIGWGASLASFAIALVWTVALYPLRQVVLARFILRMHPRALDAAIAVKRDHRLAAAEALCYLLSALCLSAW